VSDDVTSYFKLTVRRTRLSFVDYRAFPVAAARVWNEPPLRLTSVPSLRVFIQLS